MAADPRKHHFVSRCYLKAFSVIHKKVPQICVFDRVERRSFSTGIDNVASERDFNRFEAEGHDPNALERAMSSFETELGEALARINAIRSLANVDDRAYLLNFIGLMAPRTPRFRATIGAALEDSAKITMDLILQSKQSYDGHVKRTRDAGSVIPEVSYEDMKRMFDAGGFKVEANREYQIQQELKVFDKVLPLIFRRGWHLLRAPASSGGFITSDHPFALFWSDPKMRGGFFGPGLGLPKTEIVFPVSPRLAVIGAFEIKDDEGDVSDEAVASINGAAIATAQRQVYSRDHNFMYLMQYNEQARKASKLINDPAFIRQSTDSKSED